MNNRIIEIEKAIDKKNQEIVTLQNELKEIQRNCDHKKTRIISSAPSECHYLCTECDFDWWF